MVGVLFLFLVIAFLYYDATHVMQLKLVSVVDSYQLRESR
jgi:hypothetical protein